MATATYVKDPEKVAVAYRPERYLPERIRRLRDLLNSAPWELDIDRMKYFTESYKKTEGELPAIRAAKGLEETLSRMTIRIDDDELIVGAKSSKRFSAPIYVEAGGGGLYLNMALKHYKSGTPIEKTYPKGFIGLSADFLKGLVNITEEECRTITEDILPYWRDKSSSFHLRQRMEQMKLAGDPVPSDLATLAFASRHGSDEAEFPAPFGGHISIGLNKVLKMGMKGIARQAAERLAKLGPTEENYERRRDFLEAAQRSAKAVCDFAERYAKLAEKMAVKAGPERRGELLTIAERCRRVPAETPRTLLEAIPSVYFIQAAVLVACGDASIICPGRIDQYLYPFYQQDLEAGRITREQALEAVMEYYIKVAHTFNGPNDFTIGGIDRKGENAVNEMSYLFLEAHRNLKGLRNALAVRLDEKTPREFLLKACEVHRHTAGIAFFNDAIVMRDLMADGYSLEDARDWCDIGCTEVTGSGDNNGNTAAAGMFHVTLLEMALNEGGWSVLGWKPAGLKTPPVSTFKSFEDVKKAFADQVAHCINKAVRRIEIRERIIAEYFPQPLLSSTIEGCVESARDITAGGAKYNSASIGNQGIATQADSLAAIKWAVFDKKLVTLKELVKHLHNNFEGAEELRQQLLNAPKFGNDNPYVDEIAVWVAENFTNELKKHKYWLGGVHRGCFISSMTQDMEGLMCAATPDGRLAGIPVSNGLSPTNGMERNGMTAALCSGAMASIVPMSDGTAFNIKINPSTIKTDEGLEKFASAIEAYFALGGRNVNFNPVSAATLLDAQQHPENYPELQVKVSGFSFRFIDLPRSLQNDVINRTEFSSC